MTSRQRISHVDTAWLRMDRPENLMQILGVMVFKGRVDAERFKHTVARRMLRYERFRQIATEDSDAWWWVDDSDFDIDAHVRHWFLPAPCGKHELQKFVAEMASTPLNPARPRWEFNLVDMADGNSALVVRIHHAIGDGIALLGVIHSLTDDQAEAPEEGGPPAASPGSSRTLGRLEDEGDQDDAFWRLVLEPLTDIASASIRVGGHLWGQYLGLRNDPARLRDYARVASAVAQEVSQLALMPNDTPTRYKGKPGTVKRVAWSEPLLLSDIKAVGKALGCSVNDTLLASVAGALRSYLVAKGDHLGTGAIRAMVPVNLRAPEGRRRSRQSLWPGRTRTADRHREPAGQAVRDAGPDGCVEGFVSGDADLHPPRRSRHGAKVRSGPDPQTADQQDNGGDDQRTRVSQQPRYFAGSRIDQQMVWVPQAGDIGMGVSILSYNGRVQFGLITDKNMVDDPEQIVSRFADEFEKLLWLLLLEPWDRLGDPAAVEEDLSRLINTVAE
jgi:diacylglycerol O-acyltransferase